MSVKHLTALVVLSVGLGAGCGGSGSTSSGRTASASPVGSSTSQPSSGATGSLAALALTASEATQAAGAPVTEVLPPDSDSLTGPHGATLDLCSPHNYPSESLRQSRHQVNYLTSGPTHLTSESNEIVRYQPGGAKAAYNEVRAAAKNCQAKNVNGARVTRLVVQPRTGQFAPEQLTVTFAVTQNDRTLYDAAVYQYIGDLFTGIYVYRGSAQDALNAATALAAASYAKVRQAAAQ